MQTFHCSVPHIDELVKKELSHFRKHQDSMNHSESIGTSNLNLKLNQIVLKRYDRVYGTI